MPWQLTCAKVSISDESLLPPQPGVASLVAEAYSLISLANEQANGLASRWAARRGHEPLAPVVVSSSVSRALIFAQGAGSDPW